MEIDGTRRRPDGVTILALWYLVLAAGALVGACLAAIPLGIVSMAPDLEPGGRMVLSLLAGSGLTVTVIFAGVAGLAAWGLWRMRDWARVLVMLLALVHLPFFPVGTAIGVATLWYLSSHPEALAAFRSNGGRGS